MILEIVLGLSLVTWGAGRAMSSRVHDFRAPVIPPPLTTILMPTFREEKYIRNSLLSLTNQNVRFEYPERFEVLLVDSGSDDRTVEYATPFVSRVINASRGLLNAKDLGVKEARGEVIVGVNADVYYPPNWLNMILSHYQDPEVSAVGGPWQYGLPMPDAPLFLDWASVWVPFISGTNMPGGNSSFRRDAYYRCGGFDLSTDQTRFETMILEEEHQFPLRLSKVGRFVWDWQALVYYSARDHTEPSVVRSFDALSYPNQSKR